MKHQITARTNRPLTTANTQLSHQRLRSRRLLILGIITLLFAVPIATAEPIRIVTSSVKKSTPVKIVTVTTKLSNPVNTGTPTTITGQPPTTTIHSIRSIKLAPTNNPIRLTALQTTPNVTAIQVINNPPTTDAVVSPDPNPSKIVPVNPVEAFPLVVDTVPSTDNADTFIPLSSNSQSTENPTAAPDAIKLNVPLTQADVKA